MKQNTITLYDVFKKMDICRNILESKMYDMFVSSKNTNLIDVSKEQFIKLYVVQRELTELYTIFHNLIQNKMIYDGCDEKSVRAFFDKCDKVIIDNTK